MVFNLLQTDSRFSGEVTELMHCYKPAIVTNTVARSLQNAVSGGEPVHNKKRKRILSLLDSIQYAFSERKKLHMQMEQNVSIPRKELRSPLDIPAESKDMVRSQYDACDESCKKRKVFHKQKVSSQSMPNGKHSEEPDDLELNGETGFLFMAHLVVVPANDLSNGALVCKARNAVSSNENVHYPIECLDLITDGDYMVSLGMDDHDDEKHYRVARDNLLSPSLLEIKFQRCDVSLVDDVDLTVKEAINVGLSSTNCCLDAAVNSLSLTEPDSWIAHNPPVQEDDRIVGSTKAKECNEQD